MAASATEGQSATPNPSCPDAFAAAVAAMRRRLAEKARDGQVALADVEAVLGEFLSPDGALARALLAQGQANRSGRKGAFHRLMVRPFETLLDGKPPPFPRAYLPNYFRAVEASGGSWLPRSEEICRTVLQSLLLERGHKLEWEAFYADPRVRHILAFALRHLFDTLETPNGKWQWEQMMLRPDREGRAPAKAQADLVTRSLRDTWRALEMEIRNGGG